MPFLLLEVSDRAADIILAGGAVAGGLARVILRAGTLAEVANKLDEMHHVPPDDDVLAVLVGGLNEYRRDGEAKFGTSDLRAVGESEFALMTEAILKNAAVSQLLPAVLVGADYSAYSSSLAADNALPTCGAGAPPLPDEDDDCSPVLRGPG